VSAQYRWNDQLMTYASWSQGFKSGGYNERYNAPTPGNLPISFSEENADTFEVGFKADPSSSLRLNGAVFRTTYDDIQQIYRLGIVNLLFNGGKARIQGAELEYTFVPTEDLIIEGSGSYLDDKIKSVTPIPGTTATITPDNSLPFTPKWKLNTGIGYTLHPTNSLNVTPRINGTYTSSYFFDAGNTSEVMYNGTLVLDASISIENPDQMWTLIFGVQNLTDKDYRLAGNASLTTATGYAEVIYARQRNWFVSLSANF
jgi:iron complex outermembrane receptor protein